MWVIENVDDAGEGMFVCDAPNRKAALRIHRRKNKGMKVTSCEEMKWVDLAFNQRGAQCELLLQARKFVKRNRLALLPKPTRRNTPNSMKVE